MTLPDSISNLHPIDAIALAFIGYHGLMGIVRGFAFQCVRLLTWITAVALSRRYCDDVVAQLKQVDPTMGDATARAIAFLAIVVGTLLLGLIVVKLSKKLIESWKLATADRALGFVLGVGKAVAIVLVVMAVMTRFAPALGFSESLAQTQTAQLSESALNALEPVLPEHVVEDYESWIRNHTAAGLPTLPTGPNPEPSQDGK